MQLQREADHLSSHRPRAVPFSSRRPPAFALPGPRGPPTPRPPPPFPPPPPPPAPPPAPAGGPRPRRPARPIGGSTSPTSLLTCAGPVSTDPVSVALKQAIG